MGRGTHRDSQHFPSFALFRRWYRSKQSQRALTITCLHQVLLLEGKCVTELGKHWRASSCCWIVLLWLGKGCVSLMGSLIWFIVWLLQWLHWHNGSCRFGGWKGGNCLKLFWKRFKKHCCLSQMHLPPLWLPTPHHPLSAARNEAAVLSEKVLVISVRSWPEIALWGKMNQVLPALAFSPGNTFLSSEYQSPFTLVTSLTSLLLTSQPSIPPRPAWWFLIQLFPNCSLFQRAAFGEGLCTGCLQWWWLSLSHRIA